RRLLEIGLGAGVVLGLLVALSRPWLVLPFSDDALVRAKAETVLWFVAALQPIAAAVFVFDGILIGAGDSRYLALAMIVASVVYGILLAVVIAYGATLAWLWAAFTFWMLARWAGLYWRFRTDRWAVVGASAPE
ncbi:MAG: MATE family efflux transporter, partial [Acidimicrobiia bacterium]|nr:MATE family efflux transporter [Acidimicrobiia bacterium]